MSATPVNLGIDLNTYDDTTSISMTEARAMMRGRKGHVSLEVCRRWTNPKRGCRPRGKSGPLLVLPAVRIAGELRTMKEWVTRFERQRQVLGRREPFVPTRERTTKEREAAIKRAEETLDRMGVK